jgi:RNA polymerase sigma-70 factor (ECF subfamily)
MDLLYLNQVLAGNTSKFSYFIEQYKDMAFSIAFRIVNNRQDAEEVVQDSFLRAYKSLGKFRGDSKFSTWFYRIVVNNALSRKKKDNADPDEIDISLITDKMIHSVETTYKNLTRDDQRKFIDLALAKLKMEDRLLLTLFYLNENTVEEIAEITGIAVENIKMQLHRARKKLYTVLLSYLKNEIQNLL